MITRVQNTPKQQTTFTAKWPNARKVIASLPEEHDFFKGLNYTLDGKTLSVKEVLLARLDKAAEVVKNRVKNSTIFNLDMPDFSNIYKNPKKIWKGLREQYFLAGCAEPYRPKQDYVFKRTSVEFVAGKKTSAIQQYDSVNDVANFLIYNGKALVKELKKAGLENPKEIVM
jgi:hypothetical protein